MPTFQNSTLILFAASLVIPFSLPESSFAQAAGVDADEFRRIPPKSPEEELAHLHIKDGFRLELVAAEPLVEDPVAMCFDEHRRLFVVELHDHQHQPDPQTSKIKVLTDENGDGRYDQATVLADGLSWVTAIAPWDGGVFIGASPDLIYLKDTDGDGRADLKEIILTGFDHDKNGDISKSYHHERSLNNLNWAPGNRFFCAGGMNGGFIKNLAHPESPPMELRKLDFSFDPLNRTARPETGSSQHGMAVDDWGNRYQTQNSNPALFPSYPFRYRMRNPKAALPPAMASIARPSSKGPVFRRSTTEPWREARTRLRAAGLERGPVEQGGSVSGYFTGTADSAIYRGGLFPSEYYGDLFVGEVSENVVHHRKIIFPDDRVEPDAIRPDDEPDFEFIASSDNWFRPVQTINGPGGALYICDMYREVVEAWHTIPEYIREHLDRDSGKDRGRIWRVVPDEEPDINRDLTDFGNADVEILVEALTSPDGWERDTASRLIYQSQDASAIPHLEELLSRPEPVEPRSQLLAAHALNGLGTLNLSHALPCLNSAEPGLRIHGLRLLEILNDQGVTIPVEAVEPLLDDPDPRVLYQLAFNFSEFFDEQTDGWHSRIAKRFPDDEWLAMAVTSSTPLKDFPGLLSSLMESESLTSAAVRVACHEAGRLKLPLPSGFSDLATASHTSWIPALQAYGKGLRTERGSLAKMFDPEFLADLRARSLESIADETLNAESRRAFLELLPLLGIPEKDLVAITLPLFSPGIPDALQTAALDAFRAAARSESAGESLATAISEADAHLRPALIQLMTRRATWCHQLLNSVNSGTLQPTEIPASDASFLRNHSDPAIAKLAAEILPPPVDRSTVVATFQKALSLSGESEKGEKFFRERCLVCHQAGDEGGTVGPAMGEFQSHGKGQIMLNLLAPNKTVQPDYIGYLLKTPTGEAVIGRVLDDTSAGVTIRDAAGIDREFSRDQIASLVSTGRSLMPEGIEAGMSEQDLADLLAFIASFRP